MTTNMFMILHLQVLMGKNKGKMSEVKGFCLLFAGEESIPLIDYLHRLATDIMTIELPPGELPGGSPVKIPAMLIPPAQEAVFRIIHMVTREFDAGRHFATLSETNLVMTDSDLPKIARNNLKVNSKDEEVAKIQKRDNIHRLRDMLDRVLMATSPLYLGDRGVNPEFSHLLSLLRDYQPGRCLFLIKYHFSSIPISNRGQAYIQLYDHTMDVLKINDPAAYVLVVSGVDIPADWHVRCQGNEFLADSLQRGEYDVDGTRFPWTTEINVIPFKYLRNRPSHAQEGAAAALAPRGVKFTPADLARAMYIRMPWTFVSLQKSLHFVGALNDISGFIDLFPGRLIIQGSEP